MTSLVALPTTTAPAEQLEGEDTSDVDVFIGPQLPPSAPQKPMAFLPNLMPTYKTQGDDGGDGMHMFSLVHQKPHVDQGWTPMKRGLHLSMLLVDRTTLGILERLGAVDWVPLPGGLEAGSAGIYCYTPDKGAAKMIRDGVADNPVPKTVAAKVEESLMALEALSLQASAAEDKDQEEEEGQMVDVD